MLRAFITICIFFSHVHVLLAQQIAHPEEAFQEEMRAEVNANAVQIVGLIVPHEWFTGKELFIAAPQGLHGRNLFCVEVLSANGVYHAPNPYSWDADLKDTVIRVPFSREDSFDKLFDLGALAVNVRLGDCRNPLEGKIIEVLPSANAGKQRKVTFAINSTRDTVFWQILPRVNARQLCKFIVDGPRTMFDTMCEVEILPTEDRDHFSIQFDIERHGRLLKPATIELLAHR